MAKVVSDEILKLKIVVNGDEAQKRVLDLERANNQLANRISDLKNKEKELSSQRKKNPEEIAKIKSEINSLNKQIAKNREEIDLEIKSMDIMSLTVDQLRKRMNDLNFTMKHMDPNSAGYKASQEELGKLSNRLGELKNGAKNSSLSISALADKFNHYSGLAVAFAGALTGVALSMQQVIDINNKMADAMSAVEKTTGMTTKEVQELTRAFGDFDTRTSKIDLLKIGEIGGRLGIPKEEILEFVREVDKAYVALGDSFSGGVDKVAESIGKIAGLYKETKGQGIAISINEIGSALNELGAAGAASEENIAEFAKRVGALPEALKPSITDAMALGAAFEESGIDAERGGTAYTNFISTAAKETKKFAEVMRLSEKQVKDLINSNPTEFFLKFSEGMKGMDGTDVARVLDYLKLGDQYVKSIVGAASENTERFRNTMALSAQAAADATSLQQEFDKVNNNSAAIYDKVRKKFIAIFTSDAVAKALNWIISTVGKMIGAVEDADGKVTAFRNTLLFFVKILTIVSAAMLTNNLLMGTYNTLLTTVRDKVLGLTIVEKARNVVNSLGNVIATTTRALLWLLAAGYSLLTGNIAGATFAMRGFTAAIMANPIGAIITLVTALGTALYFYKQRQDEAREAARRNAEEMNRFGNIQKETMEKGRIAVDQFKDSTELLIRIMKSNIATTEQKKKAYEALIKLHPELADQANKEYTWTNKMADAYENLAYKIELAARAKARAEARKSIYNEIEEDRISIIKNEDKVKKEQDIRNAKRAKNADNLRKAQNGRYGAYDGPAMAATSQNEEISKKDFTEHNKEVEKRQRMYNNNVLLKKLSNDDQVKISELLKKIKSATGNEKKYLQMELDSYYPTEISETPVKSNYKIPQEKEPKVKKSKAEIEAERAQKKYENEREKILKTSETYNQRMAELEAERIRYAAELQRDGYEKERDLITAEQEKNIAALEKKKVSEKDFEKIHNMIAKEKDDMKVKLQEVELQWKNENARISALQEQEKSLSNLKLLKINEKYLMDTYKKEEEAMQLRLDLVDREKNKRISSLETLKDQKLFLKSEGYTDENLYKIRSWEEGRAAIEKFYQKKRLEEQLEFLKKSVAEFNVMAAINPIYLTPDQIKKIEEYQTKIAELTAEISRLKNGEEGKGKGSLSGKLDSIGGRTDILGLTPDQWDAMFTNTDKLSENIQKVGAALQVAQNMFAMYSSFVQANEQRMLQQYEFASKQKQTRLEKQLKAGLITQETYKRETLANEKELDKKKAEIEYEAAKRQRMMDIANAITSTAVGIAGALSNKPWTPLNFVLAGLVGAMGAVQVATIMSQPMPTMPGAEDGFYPVIRQQDNKMFRARRKRSETGIYDEPTMLVGEAGKSFPELVVSGTDLQRVDPEITNMFMKDIARVKGYEQGLYPNMPPSSSSNREDLDLKLLEAINKYTDTMDKIQKYGISAKIEKNAQNGKESYEMQNEYLDLVNKNKH
ncbi:phage tail tape measure protein [Elizabethkingia anophelis]|uniref:phage tail tape measure protein n=1 Tax=Elizabethkingia anophelis TaxID=1117645 RepID=UPI00099A9D93|nr:phage tail tape measure protein [Elizabethkingia anophelis]MDV3669158.1 phage tail tape measure protein [Elizabethkingia anophelis]MDV3894510.1 phage tail tape measure protein [Elizabethkingia anophelis]MDV3914519.1 phage tail tape measure protein [Elizabethkingia anophelis]MDV3920733.1 phage tail tape measure protein [Elizabethkingia anophelis]MDV3959180.1 phage tail tape measure protein [Elizabethkingia anophelis]